MLTRLLSVLIIIHALCITPRAVVYNKQISGSSSLGKKILSLFNSARTKVKNGRYTNAKGEKQPKALSMPSIQWDSKLAVSALKHAEKCTEEHSTDRGYGETIHASMTRNTVEIDDSYWIMFATMWIDEGRAYNYDGVKRSSCYKYQYAYKKKDDNTAERWEKIWTCGDYEQAIWSATTKMGCAYCSESNAKSSYNKNVLVCQYTKSAGLGTQGSGMPYKVKKRSSFMFEEGDTAGDTIKKVAILIAMILVVLGIIGFIVYFVWKKKKKKGMQKIEEAMDLEEVNDESDGEIEVAVPMTTVKTES